MKIYIKSAYSNGFVVDYHNYSYDHLIEAFNNGDSIARIALRDKILKEKDTQILFILSGSPLDEVRVCVAENLNTPLFVLNRLCEDEDSRVRNAAQLAIRKKSSCSRFEDSETFNPSASEIISRIASTFNIKKSIAKIIYTWYDNESAYESFNDLDSYIKYIQHDIYDMLDAADEPERSKVAKALRYNITKYL